MGPGRARLRDQHSAHSVPSRSSLQPLTAGELAPGHPSAVCPSAPCAIPQPSPSLAFLSAYPRERRVQREWVKGSTGVLGPILCAGKARQRAGRGALLTSAPWDGSPSLCRFPSNLLFTSASGELWKMVRIGGQPLGFGKPRGVRQRLRRLALPSASGCRVLVSPGVVQPVRGALWCRWGLGSWTGE